MYYNKKGVFLKKEKGEQITGAMLNVNKIKDLIVIDFDVSKMKSS